MLTTLFSFFGGSVFRMLWGEISTMLNKRQDHAHELARLQAQGELDAAQHARTMESIKFQAEQGIKVIEAQTHSAVSEVEANAWLEAVKGTTLKVGVQWVDAWNAAIRPGGATWAFCMLSAESFDWIVLAAGTSEVCGAFLGIFVADRTLFKRGK